MKRDEYLKMAMLAKCALAPTNTPTGTGNGAILVLEDFESGSTSRWAVFKDAASNINAGIVSPGGSGAHAMKVSYSIVTGGYGGLQEVFALPQNWSAYVQFGFMFYGANIGHSIRVELMDDRSPDSTTDTSERFACLLTDTFAGWKPINLAWSQFRRRTDWQPAGAQNNGLSLTEICGCSFAPLSGNGSFQLDQNQLLQAVLATAAPTRAIVPSMTLVPSPFSSMISCQAVPPHGACLRMQTRASRPALYRRAKPVSMPCSSMQTCLPMRLGGRTEGIFDAPELGRV